MCRVELAIMRRLRHSIDSVGYVYVCVFVSVHVSTVWALWTCYLLLWKFTTSFSYSANSLNSKISGKNPHYVAKICLYLSTTCGPKASMNGEHEPHVTWSKWIKREKIFTVKSFAIIFKLCYFSFFLVSSPSPICILRSTFIIFQWSILSYEYLYVHAID